MKLAKVFKEGTIFEKKNTNSIFFYRPCQILICNEPTQQLSLRFQR